MVVCNIPDDIYQTLTLVTSIKLHEKNAVLIEDLEERAGVLLESGYFIALRKERGKTYALYELYGRFVEVIVKQKDVQKIDFLYDTNKLAMYVRKKEVKAFFVS